MLKSGANVNARDENGSSLVMWAAYRGGVPLVQTLVEHGADIQTHGVIWIDREHGSDYGSVLSIAAGEGKIELLRYLLDLNRLNINMCEFRSKNWGNNRLECTAMGRE